MATFKYGQGSVVSGTNIIISDAITSSGNTDFEIIQPANTIVEDVVIRVIDTITITQGDIGFIMGYSSDHTGSEAVNGGTDGLLDDGTQLPAGTVFKASSATGFELGFATGDTTSESAKGDFKSENTTLYGRINCTTAASAQGKLEVCVLFRHFHGV
tara:strand:+ start:328 stop:798 length:471 start_codon:yes stop_codon:yes gene_type:complete